MFGRHTGTLRKRKRGESRGIPILIWNPAQIEAAINYGKT